MCEREKERYWAYFVECNDYVRDNERILIENHHFQMFDNVVTETPRLKAMELRQSTHQRKREEEREKE